MRARLTSALREMGMMVSDLNSVSGFSNYLIRTLPAKDIEKICTLLERLVDNHHFRFLEEENDKKKKDS